MPWFQVRREDLGEAWRNFQVNKTILHDTIIVDTWCLQLQTSENFIAQKVYLTYSNCKKYNNNGLGYNGAWGWNGECHQPVL